MEIITKCLAIVLVLSISGCQRSFQDGAELDEKQQEYILSKVNNYPGLIKLYREKLNRKDDPDTRLKLAEYHYLQGDYESAHHYLQPLLESGRSSEAVNLLESKTSAELGKTDNALIWVDKVLTQNAKNGDAWNIKGTILAEKGDYAGAQQAFEQARLLFVADDVVLNNMAMLAIMQEDYPRARDYLIPLYERGHSSQRLLHNLVYVLVKLQDFKQADGILRQQRLTDSPEGVLESLAKVSPRSQTQLRGKPTESTKPNLVQPQTLTPKAVSAPLPAPVLITNTMLPEKKAETPPVLPKQTREIPPPVLPVTFAPADVATTDIATNVDNASPSGQEKASLSVTGNLKEVKAVRTGQHKQYFRMTLESDKAINFREVESGISNKRAFELYNVKLNHVLLKSGERINKSEGHIKNINFMQKDVDTVLIDFELTKPVMRSKIFRLSKDKASQERLVFDIYHG